MILLARRSQTSLRITAAPRRGQCGTRTNVGVPGPQTTKAPSDGEVGGGLRWGIAPQVVPFPYGAVGLNVEIE